MSAQSITEYILYRPKMLSLYQILPIVLFILVLLLLWNRRKLYYLSYKLPGPVGLPIVGNAIELECINKMDDLSNKLCNIKKKYGDLFRIWLGPELYVILSEPEDMECIYLSKQMTNKGPEYKVISDVTGPGLITASGPLWKLHRYIINPSFNKLCLKKYQEIHDKHARHLVENMTELCDKGIVDATIRVKQFADDILVEALFGIPSYFYKGELDDVVETVSRIGIFFLSRMTKPWLKSSFIYKLTSYYRDLQKIFNIYKEHHYTQLNEKIDQITQEYKEKSYPDIDLDDEESKNRKDRNTMELLVEAHLANKISRDEILHEFNNIFTPGADTVYTAFSFFILMMGMHKRCQDLVWKEINDVFSNDLDAEVLPEHLYKFSYLEMCLKEISRLFPTGPIQMRESDQDFFMKHRNLVIPKGCSIALSTYMLHRNPKYWEKPLEFIPERFSPEISSKRPYFAYIPFSAGLRNCLGQVLGTDMMKTAAIHIIRKMEFHSDLQMKDISLGADISVRSKIGYPVKITRRKTDI